VYRISLFVVLQQLGPAIESVEMAQAEDLEVGQKWVGIEVEEKMVAFVD
jgi:hypothetical protein